MKITHQKAKGFTLVELLVVIAIIAVLAALSTPVIMKALTRAKIVSAKAICVSLGTAVDRFESEYSYLPSNGSATGDERIQSEGDVMAALAGEEADSTTKMNFKDIKFFNLGAPKSGSSATTYKDGMDITGNSVTLYDAWGGKYYLVLDANLDGKIGVFSDSPANPNEVINGKLALVYSSGPKGVVPSAATTRAEWREMPANFNPPNPN